MTTTTRRTVVTGAPDLFAFDMSGRYMAPKYEQGDIIWVNPTQSPRLQRYVLICPIDQKTNKYKYLGRMCYVGLLTESTRTHWTILQYNPRHEFPFDKRQWACLRIHGNDEYDGGSIAKGN